MLTAHRPSFPTCLFHPRRVHLLCHLDSPSVASLPYLGLQEQTGPEVFGLCGKYKVPSRSSLLPRRTLSPGGSRSQANKPHAVQNCVPQQTQGKQTQASQGQVQKSQDVLTVIISEQGPHAQARSAFPRENRDSSPNLTWTFRSGNAHTGFLSQTDSMAINRGKHAFFSTPHRLPLCNRHTRGLLQTGSYGSCSG
jgi:hypothetical protein